VKAPGRPPARVRKGADKAATIPHASAGAPTRRVPAMSSANAHKGCVEGDRPLIGGSCRLSKGRVDTGDPIKSIPKPGAERAIVECAADLEQQVSANS
jgi:hypothetical protein